MRKRVWLYALFAGLSGCQTIQGVDDALVNLVGPATQARFTGRYLDQPHIPQYYNVNHQSLSQHRISFDGRSIPADQIRQQNLVHIAPMQNYLQTLVKRLTSQWPGQAPTIQVQITDSYGFGPSADPYGTIYVPLGMLDSVESEDEIAAMLAHEISHVLLRHHDRLDAFERQKTLLNNMASAVAVGTVVANSKLEQRAGKTSWTDRNPEKTQETLGKTVLYTALFDTFSDNIWSTAWGRAQEDQADLLGADLMIAAGYAPRAATHSLQRLQDYQGKQKPLLQGFLSARKTALEEAVKTFNINSVSQEVNIFLREGVGTSLQAAGQYLTRSHMSAATRDENLRKYLTREYAKERRARVKSDAWRAVREQKTVVDALQAYQSAYGATVALEQNKRQEAAILIKRALNSPVKNQPGIRRAAFSLYLAEGKPREAFKALNAIEDWSLASPGIYDVLIGAHLQNGDGHAALATIEKAERHLGSQELFIVEKLSANRLLERNEALVALGKACEQYPSRKAGCAKIVAKKS